MFFSFIQYHLNTETALAHNNYYILVKQSFKETSWGAPSYQRSMTF